LPRESRQPKAVHPQQFPAVSENWINYRERGRLEEAASGTRNHPKEEINHTELAKKPASPGLFDN
jgi:hypothetical protein